MLDKSLEYFDFIMKMPAERLALLPEPQLPEGYTFSLYTPGDEKSWAELEASVNEFASVEKALEYFKREYVDQFQDELCKKCMFIKNPQGKLVSTATAWFMDSSIGYRRNWLQWISSSPEEQGKGLGKAVVIKALKLYNDLGLTDNVYLHTQTWSHTAIYLYHKLGFEAFTIDHVKVAWDNEQGYRTMRNSPMQALEELKKVFKPELLASLHKNILHPTAAEGTDFPPRN
ncbi:MAG: GNAT family N-acetyltransferase [Lentisphaerae bacterium]|nr:GNAT family N-acetyltransferase [Lentisphaerota bacterium]